MKLTRLFFLLLLAAVLTVLAACGSDEAGDEVEDDVTEEDSIAESNDTEELTEDEQNEEEVEENEEETEEASTTPVGGTIENPAIAEESGGTVEVLYTNTNPGYSNDIEGLVVTVNSYQIAKVTDMNQSEEFKFNEDLEGYVVTADVSIENTQDKMVKYNAITRIQMEDRFDYVEGSKTYYIPEEKKLTWENTDDIGKFEAGSSHNYYVTFLMSNEEYEKLSTIEPKLVIEANASHNDDFSDSFGQEAVFDFVLNDEHGDAVASAPDFYHDKLTTDNIATKELIFENLEMNETQDLDGFSLTIEGVQYTTITPNESSKERFSNFGDDELVAMTIKTTMDNQSDINVFNDTSAMLVANDNEARIISQGMVENSDKLKMEPGQTGERYIVFLFEKKYFDIYETFQLEIGPFLGEDGYIFKEKEMVFELPSGK